MKECFKELNLRSERLGMIDQCNDVIEEYQAAGLKLTLRQLYYQLVTKNIITNEERSYKNLGNLLSDARLAGLVDWDAIEDRVRVPKLPNEFKNLSELVNAALRSYRLPRWDGQDAYVELWVEKDAISGVLSPMATRYHVTLMVNRGYSSQSAMYEAANRFRSHNNKDKVLLYLGDHDPSGEDMVRDIRDRLVMFGEYVHVEKIALLMSQIEQYNPPPNPTKITDSRANGYIKKHGESCWEVDALPPDVLHSIVESKIRQWLDAGKMQAIIEKENDDKAVLRRIVAEYDD